MTPSKAEPYRRLKAYMGYRGVWRKVCYVHPPDDLMSTEVVVTNAGYMRKWVIPWDQPDADPQQFFERTVDIMIEAYRQDDRESPTPLDLDVNWKGDPFDFQVEGES